MVHGYTHMLPCQYTMRLVRAASAMWGADASAAAQLHTNKHSLSVRKASAMRDADATAAAQSQIYNTYACLVC